MEEKEIYQVDNEVSKELEKNLSESETYYTDELYDKLQVNFVRIELVCNQCTSVFPFQSALHKYIKNKCIPF